MGSEEATISAIACTLDAGDYKERLTKIAELARDALRSCERDGLTLHLRYDAAAVDRAKEMVRREQECCAFLTFEIQDQGEEIVVMGSAPEQARIAAEAMFDQFVTPTAPDTPGVARAALACACAAAACGAACVAPFALPAVTLASLGTVLAWLAEAHGWMTNLAILAVATAWLWIFWQAARAKLRPTASTLKIMGVATFLLALAAAWPLVEDQIVWALAG